MSHFYTQSNTPFGASYNLTNTSPSPSSLKQAHGIVSWNPHTSTRFNVISNKELQYYKINEELLNRAVENGFDDLSEIQSKRQEEIFTHISTTSLSYPAKCFSWSPDHRDIIAVGLQSGTIVLDNLKMNKIVTEFVPKSVRPCKSISWNTLQSNYIAAGFDGVRSDGGVLVWDINTMDFDGVSDYAKLRSDEYVGFRTKSLPEHVDKPVFEIGISESASSVCWVPGQRLSLLMGLNLRYMRLYDLRDYTNIKSTKPAYNIQAHNKSVLGIRFNPFDGNIFASYSDDGQVKLWDLRMLPKVLNDLPISNKRDPQIAQIEWSPSSRNVLGVLMKDGTTLKLWDLAQTSDKTVKTKISPYKSVYSPQDPITSFSFHPIISRCMLASTASGGVKYVFMKEHPKFSISPGGTIASSHKKFFVERELKYDYSDYCELMKTRAQKSIGMDFAKNLEIAKEMKEQDLIELWSWMNRVRRMNEGSDHKHPSQLDFSGIKSILTAPTESPLPYKLPPPSAFTSTKHSSSQTITESFETQSRISKLFPNMKVYSSPQRSLVIEICGWGEQLLENIHKCLTDGDEGLKAQYLNERSVAIAIFSMNLQLAARLLIAVEERSARQNNYKFLAYALGGFSSDRQKEFKEVYSSLYPMHPNAYLRASLGFLAELAPVYDFSSVLNETGMSLSDRLAFASMYLQSDGLVSYVNRMTDEIIRNGDLQGIVLTGLSSAAIPLLQNYVDDTGDIQIPCLLMKNVVPTKFEDSRVEIWLYNYRELLDQWQMWESRAFLDTKLTQYTNEKVSLRSAPEVSVKCSFCNQALVHKTLSSNRRTQITNYAAKLGGSGNYATRPKTTSCPSCRKPLPRCSICLMPFGSPTHSLGGEKTPEPDESNNRYGQLDYCFAWCTKCKHGGHVRHLMEWFDTHTTCAVSGCDCNCLHKSNRHLSELHEISSADISISGV